MPTLWHLNGAGIGFPQRSCKAEARYVAKALPLQGTRETEREQPWADTTCRRIRKILSKGLTSHSDHRAGRGRLKSQLKQERRRRFALCCQNTRCSYRDESGPFVVARRRPQD